MYSTTRQRVSARNPHLLASKHELERPQAAIKMRCGPHMGQREQKRCVRGVYIGLDKLAKR